jgi:hypothetical protein
MKYYFALFLSIFVASSNAQTVTDFTNMVLQIKEMAEKMQSQAPGQNEQPTPPSQEVQSQPATKPNDNISKVTCFFANTKNQQWSTGGQMITSCDPAVIEGQITQQYGMISTWQFLNDREIKRSFIFSAKNRSNNNTQINAYERKGKRITENVGGCMTPFEIVSETADSITIKDLPTSGGRCTAAQIDVGKDASRMPPSTYVKIKG